VEKEETHGGKKKRVSLRAILVKEQIFSFWHVVWRSRMIRLKVSSSRTGPFSLLLLRFDKSWSQSDSSVESAVWDLLK